MSIWGEFLEGDGNPNLYQNICLVNIYRYKKKTGTLSKSFQKLIFGRSPGGGTPKLCQNISLLNSYWVLISKKKNLDLSWSSSKNWFFNGQFGGISGGSTSKLCQNICLLNIYWYKKTSALDWVFQKIDFGGFRGSGPKNFGRQIAFAAQHFYTKIWFRCFVV